MLESTKYPKMARDTSTEHVHRGNWLYETVTAVSKRYSYVSTPRVFPNRVREYHHIRFRIRLRKQDVGTLAIVWSCRACTLVVMNMQILHRLVLPGLHSSTGSG